ncbi:MAG: PKD domain-containing protein [Flavisolibacter sp.]
MVLFKLNKKIVVCFLLLLMIRIHSNAQQIINNVDLEKMDATSFKVKFRLNSITDYRFNTVTLKIFRRRNGNVDEVFSKDINSGPLIKANQTYSYSWYTNRQTVKDGDELQAKIIIAYNKPAVTKAEPPANKSPKADAGGNLTVQLPLNLVVILDGVKSYDADGRIIAINWRQVSGPNTLRIASPTSYKSYVVGDFKPGVYAFELSVTDDKGASGTDRANLTVKAALVTKQQTSTAINKGSIANNSDTIVRKIIAPSAPPKLKGGPSNALIDVLLPGLGHYFVSGDYYGNDRKPAVLLITALYAGSVGGAVYYKLRSNSQHNKYIDLANFREYQKDDNGNIIGVRGANQAQATQYLNDSKNSHNNFLILTGISAGIMAADVIYTFIRGSKNKKQWKNEYSARTNLFFSSNGNNLVAGIRVKL